MEPTLEFWVDWEEPAADREAWDLALLEGMRRVLGRGAWFKARYARVNRRTKVAADAAEALARDASSGAGKTHVLGNAARDGREVDVRPRQLVVVSYDPPERWPAALGDLRAAMRIWLAARPDPLFAFLVPRDSSAYPLPGPPRRAAWVQDTALADWVGPRAFRHDEHWAEGPGAVRDESAPFEKAFIGETVELVWTCDPASSEATHADVVARYVWWSRRFAWPTHSDFVDEKHRKLLAGPGVRDPGGEIRWPGEGRTAVPVPPSLSGPALARWLAEVAARPPAEPHERRYVLVDGDARADAVLPLVADEPRIAGVLQPRGDCFVETFPAGAWFTGNQGWYRGPLAPAAIAAAAGAAPAARAAAAPRPLGRWTLRLWRAKQAHEARREAALAVAARLPFPTVDESSLRALEACEIRKVFAVGDAWVFSFDERRADRARTWRLWVYDDGVELWSPECEPGELAAAGARLVAIARDLATAFPFAAGLIAPGGGATVDRRYKLGRVAANRPPLGPWSLVDPRARELLTPACACEELRPGAFAAALCDPIDAPLPDERRTWLAALGLPYLDAVESPTEGPAAQP